MIQDPTASPIEASKPRPRPCAVKFRAAGRTFNFDAHALEVRRDDLVLVEHEQTLQVGVVASAPSLQALGDGAAAPTHVSVVGKILRVLTPEDRQRLDGLREKEREAFKFSLQKLRARGVPAKLVACELSFNEDRMVIYLASEDRLDFRPFVRDISTRFRARIDVRQIGARDAAKMIGGIGSCGKTLCCSTWLIDFRPVSIKMAKDQNLALNPQKVSGVCGRLLCCLTYEQDTYQDLRKGLPKIGKRVYTPAGEGRVKDVNVLRRRVRVQVAEGYEEFDAEQVSPMFGSKGEMLQPNIAEGEDDEVEAGEGGAGEPGVEKPERPMRDLAARDRPPGEMRRDHRGGPRDGSRPDALRSDARPGAMNGGARRDDSRRDPNASRHDVGPGGARREARPGGDPRREPRHGQDARREQPRVPGGPPLHHREPPPAALQKDRQQNDRQPDDDAFDETPDGAGEESAASSPSTGDAPRRRRRRRRRGGRGRGPQGQGGAGSGGEGGPSSGPGPGAPS